MENDNELATIPQEKVIKYTPVGQTSEIKISRDILVKHVISPTKTGKLPNDHDMMAFMALCQAQKLNPFTQDCYLLGYDTRDGPSFSIITAKSSLDKRAESNDQFDGYESGLVLEKENGELEYREGAICRGPEHPKVVGAWCKVYRKDRSRPTPHEVNREAYDSGKSRWAVDMPGMLVKCAEAGGLRKAFPNLFSGMFIEEEMAPEKVTKGNVVAPKNFVREEPLDPAKAIPEASPTVEDDRPREVRDCDFKAIGYSEKDQCWLVKLHNGQRAADMTTESNALCDKIADMTINQRVRATFIPSETGRPELIDLVAIKGEGELI